MHLMVQVIARMLGWKGREAGASDQPRLQDIAANPPPGMIVGGDLGMPAPILDIKEFREKNRARMVEIARRNMAPAG